MEGVVVDAMSQGPQRSLGHDQSPGDAVIEINDLTFRYPLSAAPALKQISLSIHSGEFVSIVGANGSGKSTLCQAVRGLVPHFTKGESTGTVRVNGKNTSETSIGNLTRDVGFVFQNPFTQMTGVARTVFEELAYGLGNLGVPPDEMRDRVEAMLEMTRLISMRDRTPFELSGGQQQRVALASILVMGQPILVIDEPTSQLDPETTDQMFELIGAARDEGRTVVLVEHKMELVAEFSSRVVLLEAGRVLLDASPAEVFADPRCEQAGTRMPESMYLRRALVDRGVELPAHPLSVRQLIADLDANTSPQPGATRVEGAAFEVSSLPPTADPLVQISQVRFSYPNGVEAITGVELAFSAGESVGIIGQNGAGKTTLAKLINGLLKPSHGAVLIGGVDTRGWTAARTARQVGYVFQNPDDQIFNKTVRGEVEYALKRLNIDHADRAARVEEALALTGLAGWAETNPYDLPMSVRKFVTIATVLALDTRVVILDEPTAGQDLAGLNLLMGLLRELSERGKCVITISHDMEFVSQNFVRTVVMAQGTVLRDAATDQVFYDRSALAQALVHQPAFVEVADHFGGPEIGLDIDALAALLRG